MLCSVSGLMANCTLQPPEKLPKDLIIFIARLHIQCDVVSGKVMVVALVILSAVMIPIDFIVSTVQIMIPVSLSSRGSSSAYAFQPRTDFYIKTSWVGEA